MQSKLANHKKILKSIGILLAVVSLLLILLELTINFPVTKQASGKTRSMSNLKQLMTGTIIYSVDYDETFPFPLTYDKKTGGGKALKVALKEYVRNDEVFVCPVTAKEKPFISVENETPDFTYINSLSLQKCQQRGLLKLAGISDQTQQAYLRSPIRGVGKVTNSDSGVGLLSPFGEQFLVAYVDGHVKMESPMPITKL